MTMFEAAQEGRLASLRALRDRVAREIDDADPATQGVTVLTALAALSNRYQDILREIDALDPPVVVRKKTPLDELAERRDAKRRTG